MFPSRLVSVLGGGVGLQNNYSLDFDGSDDYVNCGTGIGTALGDSYDGELTVSAWFKTDTADVDGSIVCFEDGEFELLIGHEGAGSLNLKTHGSGISFINFTDTSSWHHAVATWDGSANEKKIYLDGVLEDTTGDSNPLDLDGKFLLIGSSALSSGDEFNGNIDEVAIWNTALSAGSISNIYNNGVPTDLLADSNSANLQGWWRMGDGTLDSHPLIADQVNPTLGSEELGSNRDFSNGDFTDWTFSGGGGAWSVVDGEALHEASDKNGLRYSSLSLTNGAVYKGSFDIKSITVGNNTNTTIPMTIYNDAGDTVKVASAEYVIGTNTFYYTASDNGIWFEFNTSSHAYKLDNFSLKQIQGNPGLMTSMASEDIVKDTP